MLPTRPALSGTSVTASRSAPAPLAPPDLGALHEAIARCGVELFQDAYGTQSRVPAEALTLERLAAGTVAMLPGHALLTLSGDDAQRFLHSQTTNDVEHQPAGEAHWHGYCTAKGRLLATMLAWRDDASLRLLVPDSLAETLRKRLTMFVLRSKVRIADERATLIVLGLAGAKAAEALAALDLPAPAPPAVSIAAGEPGRCTVVALPAIGAAASAGAGASGALGAPVPRWLLVVPVDALASAWESLREVLAPMDSEAWRWGDVRAGVAPIVPATSEQFVPQMLNLDAVGGISFTKGCYPGQEVVARSHYLGKVKRRAFLGHLPEGTPEPAPGSDVRGEAAEPVGKVALAARAPGGGVDVLFEAQVAAAASALHIAGSPLSVHELPYPLPAA